MDRVQKGWSRGLLGRAVLKGSDLGVRKMDLRKDIELGEVLLINFVNLTEEEKKLVRDWRNNEEVRRWAYSKHTISPEEHSEFIKKLEGDEKNFYWLARKKDAGYIGVISLNRVDLSNKNAYLGIYSNLESKLPGSGRLLINCLKKLAFEIAGLHTLKLEVIDNNERAINFYRRSGFSEEERLREFVLRDGKWHDSIVMGIINNKGKA